MNVKLNTREIFILVTLDPEVLQYLADRETHGQELEIRDQLYTSDSEDDSIAVRALKPNITNCPTVIHNQQEFFKNKLFKT